MSMFHKWEPTGVDTRERFTQIYRILAEEWKQFSKNDREKYTNVDNTLSWLGDDLETAAAGLKKRIKRMIKNMRSSVCILNLNWANPKCDMLDDLGTVTMIYFTEKYNSEDIGAVYWLHKMENIDKASVLGGFHLLTQGSWHLIHVLKKEKKGAMK